MRKFILKASHEGKPRNLGATHSSDTTCAKRLPQGRRKRCPLMQYQPCLTLKFSSFLLRRGKSHRTELLIPSQCYCDSASSPLPLASAGYLLSILLEFGCGGGGERESMKMEGGLHRRRAKSSLSFGSLCRVIRKNYLKGTNFFNLKPGISSNNSSFTDSQIPPCWTFGKLRVAVK